MAKKTVTATTMSNVNAKRRPEVAVVSSSSFSGFRFLGSIYALVSFIVLGVWMKQQLLPIHRYLPWHQTPHWSRLLMVYDKLASRYFLSSNSNCESKMLATSFGQTQAFACGSVENPPVLFLHGAGSNLLMYGQWLMPAFRETHYSIAVDYPCDTGRSIPPDSDPSKCPQTEEEISDWVSQVLSQLGIASSNKRTSLVGYSYGALVAFVTARHKPQLVDKLVLLAPASIFEELSPAFLYRAMVMALFRSNWSQNYFWRWLTNNPNFDLLQSPPDDVVEQLTSTREVAATVLAVPAASYSNEVLKQVLSQHETFLGIGEQEVIIKNVSVAVERARTAGAQVRMYPNAGHLMLMEVGDSITKDVVEFLLKTNEEEE